ncbi:hypothetical protein GWK47_034867 [Chionoecetes opilio]|uniref:DDE-1 domain-containing protein n=1 Tax=Chionoecetes opilio TaxID=41210 RepID=A0A8J4YUK3_CHIOP|nr:hypothetical protein GWK47_034867 [Chionoecetes opilio]
MTFVGIINASGHYIPPVFIIPRKRWNDSFMRGTIDGSKGILHQNGWMNGECFLETLQHVHEKTYSSVENKILLIMDNAVCHMNIHAINYAIQHGIIMSLCHPILRQSSSPLDVSVYGPFKTYLRSLQNDFTLMNPNTCITEHMLPEFASKAWIKSSTPTNILSGFAATGIWPINRLIFPDEAFAGAEVTERPPPQADGQELPDLNPDWRLLLLLLLGSQHKNLRPTTLQLAPIPPQDLQALVTSQRSLQTLSGPSPKLLHVLLARGERRSVPAFSPRMRKPSPT